MSASDSAPGTAPALDSKRRRWLHRAAEIGAVLLIIVGVQWWQARDVPAGAAPSFAAPMADGGSGGLDAWRAAHPGKAIGVYFWAEWCPICKLQEGNVDALRSDWPVYTVAMRSGTAAAVAKALNARGLDWPTAIDTDGRITGRYGLHGVPAFVVIDGRGEIRSVMVGYSTELGMRLRLWWAATVP